MPTSNQSHRVHHSTMSFWDRLTESEQQDCIEKNAAHRIARRNGYSPRGIVRQKWTTDIYPAIKDIMNDPGNRARIYGSSSKHPICSFRLFMLESSAAWKPTRPTIVVLCIDKKFAKRAVELLEKMPVLEKPALGFDFLTSEEEIRLAADESEAASPVARQTSPSLCGAGVLISPSQINQTWARTTIGGVIVIDGRSYALTAAHAFFRTHEDVKPKFSDVVSSNGTSSEISDVDDQDHDNSVIPPEARSPTQSDGNRREAETRQLESRFMYLDDQNYSEENPSVDSGRAVQQPASVREENLIGIIEISTNPHELRSSQFSLENDWAIFEISSSRFNVSNSVESPTGDILQTVNVAQTEPNGPVLITAGVSGVLQTECSGLLSGIILPNSRKMLDAWTLPKSCRELSNPQLQRFRD